MTPQDLFDAAIAFCAVLGGWVLKTIWDSIKDLKHDIKDAIKDIKDMLGRIFDKLDDKLDKGD